MLSTEEKQRMQDQFDKTYGKGSGGRAFFSPSRINIIGEHIDYNGGDVLPCAIEIGTYALVRKRSDSKIRLMSINKMDQKQAQIQDMSYQKKLDWFNYPLGMIKMLQQEGYGIGGLEGVIYGNIPNGAGGLSSSASLELLVGAIINHLFNDASIPALQLAKLGQKTENQHIGVMSGILDQFAIAMSKKNHATLLNTRTMEYRHIPLELKDCAFVIMNTNKRRSLKDSKYNERWGECMEALRELQKHKDIDNLCALTPEEFQDLKKHLTQDNVIKRAEHVVFENQRVREAVKSLEKGDLNVLGQKMNESHNSLRDLYDVTGKELNAMVDSARAQKGVLGARMTGAGFGGCAIALVKKEWIPIFEENVRKKYRSMTGLRGELFCSGTEDGPREFEWM